MLWLLFHDQQSQNMSWITKLPKLSILKTSHIPKHTKNSIQEGHGQLPLHPLLHTEKRQTMTHFLLSRIKPRSYVSYSRALSNISQKPQ